MSEFNEPWEANVKTKPAFCGLKQTYVAILDSSGERVDRAVYESEEAIERQAKLFDRIAACVNACAGIPTESLDRARQFMPTLAGNFTPEQKAKLLDDLSKAGPGEVVSLPDQVEYSAALLKWRKEPPTSAPPVGYDCYWVLAPNGARFVVKVEGRSLSDGVLIYRFGQTIPSPVDRYAGYQWAGPIEPPTLPEI